MTANRTCINLTIVTISILFTLTQISVASAQDWDAWTDQRTINDIEVKDDEIWCATDGGLAVYDIESGSYITFNYINGLSGVAMDRIVKSPDGSFWLLFNNRTIQRFMPGEGVSHTVSSFQADLQALNDIVVHDGVTYVATSEGIATVTYSAQFDRWVWFEHYTNLGSLAAFIPVTGITIFGDTLWASTSSGVVSAIIGADGLSSWQTHTVNSGMPDEVVTDVTIYDGGVVAATNAGLAYYKDDNWSLIRTYLRNNDFVTRLEMFDETLYAVKRNGILTFDGNGWEEPGGLRREITSVALHSGELWVGFLCSNAELGGVGTLSNKSIWVSDPPQSVIANKILDIDISTDGTLAVVGGQGGGQYGLGLFNGVKWTNYLSPDFSQHIYSYQHTSVLFDQNENIWTGSWGGGIANYRFEDGALDTVLYFDSSNPMNSRLQSLIGTDNYVLAPSLAKDNFGNIWVVNRGAVDGNILACIPSDFINDPTEDKEWVYFHRSNINSYTNMDVIAIDGKGRKWLGTSTPEPIGRAIYILDDRGTIEDQSDDIWSPPIITGITPQVLCMEYDPAGYMWVGSIDGAYYANANNDDLSNISFTRLFQLKDFVVNDIEIDAAGNKWFATGFGLRVISFDLITDLGTIRDEPPDRLPSPTVESIHIDSRTGWAYIGSEIGTTLLRTPYRKYNSTFAVVIAPNPYNPNEGRMEFLDGLAEDASAYIYTPDGRLVRALTHAEASVGWDGTNENGNPVVDGVYFILTSNQDGNSGKTKVAVVRK